MKKIIYHFVLFSLIFTISSCSKNEDKNKIQLTQYEATGKIVGRDLALCPCCGDWIITIDNNVQPANSIPVIYQFKTLPIGSNIDLENATFPLSVKFNWSIDYSTCGGQQGRILIDDISLN